MTKKPKAWEAMLATLTADQWEGIAARQQQRLFAIYDLAENIADTNGEKPPADLLDATVTATAIMDLCRLPHAALVEAGLLK